MEVSFLTFWGYVSYVWGLGILMFGGLFSYPRGLVILRVGVNLLTFVG